MWKIDEAPGLQGGIYGTPGHQRQRRLRRHQQRPAHRRRPRHRQILWERRLPPPTWGSPVIVDDTLLLGDCLGDLHAFDVSDPLRAPPELWTIQLGGCIEATPAVWKGRIYIGTRAGHLYILGDARPPPPAAPTDEHRQGHGHHDHRAPRVDYVTDPR